MKDLKIHEAEPTLTINYVFINTYVVGWRISGKDEAFLSHINLGRTQSMFNSTNELRSDELEYSVERFVKANKAKGKEFTVTLDVKAVYKAEMDDNVLRYEKKIAEYVFECCKGAVTLVSVKEVQ